LPFRTVGGTATDRGNLCLSSSPGSPEPTESLKVRTGELTHEFSMEEVVCFAGRRAPGRYGSPGAGNGTTAVRPAASSTGPAAQEGSRQARGESAGPHRQRREERPADSGRDV